MSCLKTALKIFEMFLNCDPRYITGPVAGKFQFTDRQPKWQLKYTTYLATRPTFSWLFWKTEFTWHLAKNVWHTRAKRLRKWSHLHFYWENVGRIVLVVLWLITVYLSSLVDVSLTGFNNLVLVVAAVVVNPPPQPVQLWDIHFDPNTA